MGRTVRTVRVTTLALALLAGVSALVRAGAPPTTQPVNPAQSLQVQDPAALRVSPGTRPTFKILSGFPLHDALVWAGPDLVPVEPRIGNYAGQVMVSGQAVGAWEIFWRVKNQGGKPAAASTIMRATCTPMNINPALLPQAKLWLSALMCDWLNVTANVPGPLAAGGIFEKLSWITYPSNLPCTAAHPRVTVKVDTLNAVNEGPREDNNQQTYDFCQ